MKKINKNKKNIQDDGEIQVKNFKYQKCKEKIWTQNLDFFFGEAFIAYFMT